MTAPYRNEIDALRERRTSLEAQLATLREQTTTLDALRAHETELAAELSRVVERLEMGGPAKRALPLLEQVRVASPCSAEWNDMIGDDRVRFCCHCQKDVFNLSSMAAEDAETFLQARYGSDLCVRFYRRTDGTLLTQDCPVGVTTKRRKALVFAIAGAGAMVAATAALFLRGTTSCTKREGVTIAVSQTGMDRHENQKSRTFDPPHPDMATAGGMRWTPREHLPVPNVPRNKKAPKPEPGDPPR